MLVQNGAGMMEDMETSAAACSEQQKLMDEVIKHLRRIADLSRETVLALEKRDDDRVRDLDHQVEQEIGRKERALGRLRQHREDHGC